jgi:tellurite resistance protein
MTEHQLSDTPVLTAQDSLVALMVAVSAADETIRTAELVKITTIVNNLPVFGDYDASRITQISRSVFDLLEPEEGLDALFGLIRGSLPERLYETAYALSCDVAAADGVITGPEGRMLEEIREELSIDRLHAAAIERGARARHMTL